MSELLKKLSELPPEKRERFQQLLREKLRGQAPKVEIPRFQESGPHPLSFAQQGLWMLDRLHEGGSVYNISRAYWLEGHLDVAVLEVSLEHIVHRHGALRARFEETEDGPVQEIAPPAPCPLPRVDLSGLAEGRCRDVAVALAAARHGATFDLRRGPVWRWLLLRLDASLHLLVLTFHHMVFDGWSVRVFSRELEALYNAVGAGRAPSLPELPRRYVDYAHWQRERLRGEHLEEELAFWRERLAGAPQALDLPTDRPRPLMESYRGAVRTVGLAGDDMAAVEDLGQRFRVTTFTVLLSAFAVVFSRLSGQRDLLLGEVVANRGLRELEPLVGFFVNNLVLRADLTGDPPFSELLDRIRRTVGEATTHQELPFEKVVEEVGAERAVGRHPLCQVLIGFEGESSSGLELDGLEVSPLGVEILAPETARVDLTMVFRVEGGVLAGWLEYNVDLFDATTIQRFWSHVRELLRHAAAAPERRLSGLPIQGVGARHQILVEWNDTTTSFPRHLSLPELVARQVATGPERVAVDGGDEELTYGELHRRARALAGRLTRLGVDPEDRVGLFLAPSPDLVVAMLAVLEAGGAYVPLDPDYPAERLLWMLEDARIEVVLTEPEHRPRLEEILTVRPDDAPPVILVAAHGGDAPEGKEAPRSVDAPAGSAGPASLAYIIYTSGSTGRPKGVMVSHVSVSRLVLETNYLELAPGDRVGQAANISFDATTFEVWAPLLCGATVVFLRRESLLEPRRLVAELRDRRAQALFLTTALTQQVVAEIPDAFAPLRALMTGGEAVDPGAMRRLLAGGPPERLMNIYGPTENTTFTTYHPFTRLPAEAAVVPIGQPISNTTVHVVDRGLRAVPPRVAGELLTGGEGLARGYLGRPSLTAERFVPDPFADRPGERLYKTGDLVRRRGDGAIEFLGRFDHQVKLRGFRIELGEVEAVLRDRPDVDQAVVSVLWDGAEGSARLVAHVVPDGGAVASFDVGRLRQDLETRLPSYMVPSAFVALEALPLTPNGKVDRDALPSPEEVRHREGETFLAPRTPEELAVAEIWREVLGLERVAVDDYFFEVGGNSLIATQVISRVRKIFAVEVPLRDFLVAPTVAELAKAIVVAKRSATGLELPPLVPTSAQPSGGEPLAYAQERLWFLHRLDPGNAAYTSGVALRLEGPLDVTALEASLAEIQRRHEPLRSRFPFAGGQPVAVVQDLGPWRLPVVDARGLGPRRARAELTRRLDGDERRHPFDLENASPLRALLYRLRDEVHLLVVRIHHIAFDGWSQGIFLRELRELYGALRRGGRSSLPPLAARYGDFAVWQRAWLQGEVLERQLDFWRERLADRRTLDLPTDRPRPAIKGDRGGRQRIAFSDAAVKALRSFAHREGATVYAALLTLFKILLARMAGQEQITVGSPIANRIVREIEGLIGCFANTLVLASRCPTGASFTDLIGGIYRGAVDAYAHQDVPFERLVEALHPERDLSRNPLFQVLFSLQNAPTPQAKTATVTMSPTSVGLASSPFDLALWLHDRDGRIEGDLQFDVELFDRVTVQRFGQRLRRLLEAVVATPERPVGELSLLAPAELHQIVAEWNDTAGPFPREMTLPRLVERCAAERPLAVAAVCGEAALSYGELVERFRALAAALGRRGVVPGDRVGICLERSLDMLVAVLGVMSAGAVYVPLDPTHPKERLQGILDDADAALLVTHGALEASLGAGIPAFRFDREILAPDLDATLPVLHPEHLAYAIYTSGSTGRPKGVQIPHRALVNFLTSMAVAPGFAEDDVLLALTTLAFDIAGLELYLPLVRGGRVVIAPREASLDGRRLAELIEASGATIVQATPATWRLLLESGWKEAGPSGLRLFCGGEALPRELADRLLGAGTELWNLYGPTETTIWSAAVRVARRGPIRIGRPIVNTDLHVVDRVLRLLPVGVPGELLIGGEGVARGYVGRPGLTAERFVPDPFVPDPCVPDPCGRGTGNRLYRTGDLVRRRHDGEIEFLGRLDHQVKVRGFRIETGEIETCLLEHPGVREVVVTAREDAPGDVRLVAYLVPEGAAPSSGEMREHLQAKLPDYMIPSFFVALEALPLNPNGKVDRKALPAPEAPRPTADFVAPGDELEKRVAEIWKDVLGVSRVGARDNFFDLGGHSLLMVRVHERLADELDRELAIVDLFNHPTIRSLARFLSPSEDAPAPEDEGRKRAARRQELAAKRRQRGRRHRGGR